MLIICFVWDWLLNLTSVTDLWPSSLRGRNPGPYWKRRGHRGEEEDTEEDLTKDMDDSSAGAGMEEGSMTKNGMGCGRGLAGRNLRVAQFSCCCELLGHSEG